MKEKYITIQKISFIAFFLLGTIQILNMIFISNKIFETPDTQTFQLLPRIGMLGKIT